MYYLCIRLQINISVLFCSVRHFIRGGGGGGRGGKKLETGEGDTMKDDDY